MKSKKERKNMKIRKKIGLIYFIMWTAGIATGLSLFLYMGFGPVYAAEPTVDESKNGIHWVLQDGILTISGTGSLIDLLNTYGVFIPEDYRQDVLEIVIGEGITDVCQLNHYKKLKKITMADTVEKIDDYRAFRYCSELEEVHFSENLTCIPEYTFMGCTSLKNITLPEGLLEIANNAFYESGLETIYIPASVISMSGIGENNPSSGDSFSGCNALRNIEVADGNQYFFSSDGILYYYGANNKKILLRYPTGRIETDLEIPEGITGISSTAFPNTETNIKTMILPSTLTDADGIWGGNTFNNLESIQVTENNSVYSSKDGVLFRNSGTTLVCYPANKGDTSYTVADTVKTISSLAFHSNKVLETVIIPESVTYIGRSTFSGATALSKVELPDSLETIDSYAFFGCDSLKKLNIPESVLTINYGAFGYFDTPLDLGLGGKVDYSDSSYDVYRYSDVMLSGKIGSAAHTYAKNNNISWEKSLEDAVVTFTDHTDIYYNGQPKCPEFTVTYGEGTLEETLIEEKDYSVSYMNNVNPSFDPYCYDCYGGIYDTQNRDKYAKIIITGISPCQGTIERYFLINGFYDLTVCSGVDYDQDYTGEEICPKPEIKLYNDGKMDVTLTENIDYQLSYYDNVEPGKATILVTGIGEYKGYGSYHIHFEIVADQKKDDEEEEDAFDHFTYKFGNSREDFGYSSDYTIDEETIFTKLWGNTALAKDYYNYWTENFKVWCGNCYGMSATSIMFNDNRDDIEVSGFKSEAVLVKELELDNYNRAANIRMSLLDLVESMQVSQIDETISYIIGRSNKGKISRMCDAIKDAQENNTAVIIVLDSNGPQGAHAVVGYRMEDISSTERRIHIYDCNHPNVPKYITLTMEDGVCTEWNYDGGNQNQSIIWSSKKINGVSSTISYISYDSFIKVWLNRSLEDKLISSTNIMTMNTSNASICDKDGNEVAVLKDGEVQSDNENIFEYYPVCATMDGTYDKSEIQPMIYLPTDEYVVKNLDQDVDEMKLTMCNVNRMLTVTTTASTVTMHVDDDSGANIIQVEGEEEMVQADFYSSDGSEKYKTMNFIGTVIGSSMTLGVTGGEKIIENFNVEDEEIIDNDSGNANPGEDTTEIAPDNKNTTINDSKTAAFSFKLVSATGSSKIAAGKKVTLNIVSTGSAVVNGLVFRSSNPKVAVVNKKGVVSTKKNAGGKSVVITATDNKGRTASLKLKVMKGAVKSVKISGKTTVKAGKSVKLKAKVTAGKGANKTLVWKSSNVRYAEVTGKGVVKTKKAGKGKNVKITAMATDGTNKKRTVKIKIK